MKRRKQYAGKESRLTLTFALSMYQQFKPAFFTKAVLNLLLINGAFFLITEIMEFKHGPDLRGMLSLYFPTQPEFRWYQVVTHMFMHGSFMHIFLNMFGLWQLGVGLENVWGTRRFLFYYFACGIGAMLLHSFMSYYGYGGFPVLGASGAVCGLISAYGILFPNTEFLVMFIPIPIKAKYLAILFAGYDLISGLMGTDNIGHFAHLGGMLTGVLIILYWRKFNRNTLY
jgi:membrane associated rhomboid family serine protease